MKLLILHESDVAVAADMHADCCARKGFLRRQVLLASAQVALKTAGDGRTIASSISSLRRNIVGDDFHAAYKISFVGR